MKIFSKRTTAQASLEQLIERQARLTVMRAEAKATLDAALTDRHTHLVTGDVDDVTATETLRSRLEAAHSILPGLDDAIATLKDQITNAETAIADERGRVQAEADAKALASVIAKVEQALPAWLATAREMSDLLGSLNDFRYQAAGVSNYLGGVASQTEAGLRVVLDDLSGAVAAVADGSQKIRIGKTPPVTEAAAPPPLPPKDHFTYTTPDHTAPTYRVPAAFAKGTGREGHRS